LGGERWGEEPEPQQVPAVHQTPSLEEDAKLRRAAQRGYPSGGGAPDGWL